MANNEGFNKNLVDQRQFITRTESYEDDDVGKTSEGIGLARRT